MNQHVSLGQTIRETVEEYDRKKSDAEKAVIDFQTAVNKLESSASVRGTFAASIWYRGAPSCQAKTILENLKKSAWKCVYNGLNIAQISSAADRKRFEMAIENPPEFTIDNIRATFGDYILNPRENVLRGLAEVFCALDPAYRSHNKVKIGTAGLPKRVILPSCHGYGSHGHERLRDIINALRAIASKPLLQPQELDDFLAVADLNREIPDWSETGEFGRHGTVKHAGTWWKWEGYGAPPKGTEPGTETGKQWRERPNPEPDLSMRKFQNGNAHLIFGQETLLTINRGLAEYYGDVLPDVEENADKKRPSTALAKDLQFYPTPQNVAEKMISDIWFQDGNRVLEPSCGTGALLDALPRNIHAAGIEVNPDRARIAKAKGYAVTVANFLEIPAPNSDNHKFDHVVMNPPFYGTHYAKHIAHAIKFLKPDGRLVAILPASAWYDHGLLPEGGNWKDLPVGSFAQSGTRIPTGIFTFQA